MTELAVTNTATGIAPVQAAPEGTVLKSLHAYSRDLDAALAMAETLCVTNFAPKSFQGNPKSVAAVIMKGHSLGLDPMSSLEAIFEVYGRPAMYARTMAALFIAHGGELDRMEATSERVSVRARLNSSRIWQEFEWDIDRAKQAGYMSNAKYKTNPIEMLYAKCVAEAVRSVAPHLLFGLSVAEEVQLGDYDDLGEIEDTPAKPEPKKPGRKVTTRRTAKPAPEPEQELVDEETGELTSPEPIGPEQYEAIQAIYAGRGDDMPAALADMHRLIGREITHPNQLTSTEAEQIIKEHQA